MKHLLILLTLFCCAIPCAADTLNLSVNPLVNEVRINPGQGTTTSTIITNNGDQPERITVRPIDWTTRINGGISLEPLGAERSRSLTPYMHALSYDFILQPHEVRELIIAVTLPASFSPTPASYWGGFLIRATSAQGTLSAIGPAATFFLYNDVGTPRRHLSIKQLHATATHGRIHINGLLKNEGVGYLRVGGTLTLSRDGTVVTTQGIPVGAIFPDRLHAFATNITASRSGTYTLEVKFDYGEDILVLGDTSVVVP